MGRAHYTKYLENKKLIKQMTELSYETKIILQILKYFTKSKLSYRIKITNEYHRLIIIILQKQNHFAEEELQNKNQDTHI